MPITFGLQFVDLELGHRAELGPFLQRHPQVLSGYTFATLWVWNSHFRYRWARPEPETVLISCLVEPDSNRHLLQPVGAFSPAVEQGLLRAIEERPYAAKTYGATGAFLAAHPAFAERFAVQEERDAANYVYAAEDLALLAGRRFAAKRNHLAQAGREYSWQATPLGPSDVAECLQLARSLLAELGGSAPASLVRDTSACEAALVHLQALELSGIVIRVEGRVVAYSIWEALDATTAVVHFERAARLRGLPQVVNHEAAKVLLAQGFRFINREEDLGDAGLRKAKLSYHPARIEMSHTLTFRR